MTELSHSIRLRASSAAEWMNCAQKRAYRERQPGGIPTDTHVGIEMGNAVHHAITGHEYITADRIIYDKHTGNQKEFDWQVKETVHMLQSFMDKQGWVAVGHEKEMEREAMVGDVLVIIQGSADLLVFDQMMNRLILIDIKTGVRRPSSTFMQLAIYAWLMKYTEETVPTELGFVWMPRNKLLMESKIEWISKPVDPLIKLAWNTIKTLASYSTNGYPYNPSTMNCGACGYMDCIARADK